MNEQAIVGVVVLAVVGLVLFVVSAEYRLIAILVVAGIAGHSACSGEGERMHRK